MFISVRQLEEAAFAADHLVNPVNNNNPMVLVYYRNYTSSAFFTAYTKKEAAVYLDSSTNKRISRRKWTNEMKTFASEKEKLVPVAPYKMKPTIFGYIMMLAVVGFFGYLAYDSLKPAQSIPAEYTALLEEPKAGDIYYGRFEQMKPGERVALAIGFGWFKVLSNQNGNIEVAMNKHMSKSHRPSKDMDQVDFEESGKLVKIQSQESYEIKLMDEDKSLEVYFTEKK